MSESSASTGPIICKYCGKPIAGPHIWSHGVPFHIECTNPIASNDQRIADLEKRLAEVTRERDELRKLVDGLPKTADGVTVTPGMILYYLEPRDFDGDIGYIIEECDVSHSWEKRNTSSLPLPVYASENSCYSTRAAAEAAQKGQSDE